MYFTLEGMAEVIQEKKDFQHFDLSSIHKFQNEDGEREGEVLDLLLKINSKSKTDLHLGLETSITHGGSTIRRDSSRDLGRRAKLALDRAHSKEKDIHQRIKLNQRIQS